MAKISGEEVATGMPIERRWLRLKHRTGRPSNFGKARLLVSVDFDPVGPVRLLNCWQSTMRSLLTLLLLQMLRVLILLLLLLSRRRS